MPLPEYSRAIVEQARSNFVHDVRCESCGYEIESVLREGGGRCPECGTELDASRPSRRGGTLWQRRRSPFGYLVTLWRTLGRAPVCFRGLSLSLGGGWSLMVITSLVSATAMLAPWSGVFIADPIRRLRFARTTEHVVRIFAWLAAEIGALALLLGVLSIAITFGLRVVGTSRGWRHTPRTATLIAAHAAVGWLLVAGLIWMLLTAWFIATLVAARSEASTRWIGDISGWLATHGGRIGPWTLPGFILTLGGLVVAWLTWVGLRETRFANDPAAEPLFRRAAAADAASKPRTEATVSA